MINNEELIEFYEELKDAVNNEAYKLADELIEKNPEDYSLGTSDYGYYHNGVGFATIGESEDFDEDLAYKDAIELIAQDINNNGEDYEFFYKFFANNDKLQSALAKLILRVGGM
jgi:hypothetical protein